MSDVPMTLPQAAQSRDVTGALQQLLMSRIPSQEQEQRQAMSRADALGEYQNRLRQPAMGEDYTPTLHSLYSMIGNFGPGTPTGYAALKGIAQGGAMLGEQAKLKQAGELAAAKLGYEDEKDLDKLDLMNVRGLSMLAGRGGSAGSFIQFKDDNGNLYIMNKATGQREMIPATHTKLWGDAYKLAFEKAVAETMKDPEGYATNMANQALRGVPGGIVTVDTVQKPTRPAGVQGPITPGVEPVSTSPNNSKSGATAGFPDARSPESDRQMILGQEWDKENEIIQRYKNDITHPEYQQALRNQALLKQEMRSLGAPKTPPATLEYKDKRVEEQNKGYGESEGKGLFKEYESLGQLHTNQARLLNQLTLLRKIYEDPNIPEGALAPIIHQIQSGAKSLGINVDPSIGPADLATAIATNLSLAQRTANGDNLMPGSMTTFEERLLMNMAPTLGLTSEGRKSLTEYMILVARSNMRLAEEAHKMAAANKNQLSPNWYQRKDRVMREEMLKLQHAHDQLMLRYGGKK